MAKARKPNQNTVESTNSDMLQYLDDVMARLIPATSKSPFLWNIHVTDESTLNSMRLGGGVILISMGLLKHLDSEAQLAYVIAHDMAHQL